jgi:thiosulfate dehydrogenase [quinone] large subunit
VHTTTANPQGEDRRATRSKSWRTITASQFVGLIVLFAALSAGRVFVQAGWEKWNDPAWTGDQAGAGLTGFLTGAGFKATRTERNPHPDVLAPVHDLNRSVVAGHARLFSWLVVLGELLIPAGVLALLCLRFPGSRAALIAVAGLAAGLNLLYLHEGSSGLNPPMLLLWLAVVWAVVTFPTAAQAYALDLGRLVRHAAGPRPAAPTVPGRWLGFTALLIVLAVESLLLADARTVLLLIVATLGIAGALSALSQVLAARASAIRRVPRLLIHRVASRYRTARAKH